MLYQLSYGVPEGYRQIFFLVERAICLEVSIIEEEIVK